MAVATRQTFNGPNGTRKFARSGTRARGPLLPICRLVRSDVMTETLQSLQQKMEAAALALNFEEAKRCRDKISHIRGGGTAAEAEQADFTGLDRQQPGAMGLGTSQQRVSPPPGWKPPPKPDPMTAGRNTRRRSPPE